MIIFHGSSWDRHHASDLQCYCLGVLTGIVLAFLMIEGAIITLLLTA